MIRYSRDLTNFDARIYDILTDIIAQKYIV